MAISHGYRRWWMVLAGLVGLSLAYFLYTRHSIQDIDIFEALRQRGYTPNPPLSGSYRAGDLIQTHGRGASGKDEEIRPPLIFFFASDCFHGHAPRTVPFTVPEVTDTRTVSFSLSAKNAAVFLQSIGGGGSAAMQHSIKLDGVTIETFAKGRLDGNIGEPCTSALERQVAFGDKADWYSVILESVLADSLRIEINWKDNAGTAERSQAEQAVKVNLPARTNSRGSNVPSANIEVKERTAKRTVWEARGPVVVGYRARPLERMSNPQ